jgi:hypothetical protein
MKTKEQFIKDHEIRVTVENEHKIIVHYIGFFIISLQDQCFYNLRKKIGAYLITKHEQSPDLLVINGNFFIGFNPIPDNPILDKEKQLVERTIIETLWLYYGNQTKEVEPKVKGGIFVCQFEVIDIKGSKVWKCLKDEKNPSMIGTIYHDSSFAYGYQNILESIDNYPVDTRLTIMLTIPEEGK